jgi:hypothetical protein
MSPVVYLASPMLTYGTGLYAWARERLGELFPGADLICPEDGLYPTPGVWRATYREHLERCTDLVAFDAGDHVAPRGMAEEIRYARLLGRPCWYLTAGGVLEPLRGLL